MSIVVYRDGVIASDSLITQGGYITGFAPKIARYRDGSLAGAAGDLINTGTFLRFFCRLGANFERVEIPSADASFEGIVAAPDGRVRLFGKSGHFCEIEAPYYTLGCGYEIATGALIRGATAIEAVEAAIAANVYCGGSVQSFTHEG